MSDRSRDAVHVKTAKARAGIAVRLIKAGRTHGRPFSGCFEMGDGDAVISDIVRRAATDPEIERHYPHVAVWRKDPRFNGEEGVSPAVV